MTARIARLRLVVSVLGLLLPALFVSASVRAEDARIPIHEPTVITESGSYVVTQDFTATTGSAIKFLGDITVDIDFAGHTVGAIGAPVIVVRERYEDGCPSVTFRNGRVVGSGSGVWSVQLRRACVVEVDIIAMAFENADVWVEDGSLAVRSSRFVNSDMSSDANFGGAFEDNAVLDGDIIAFGVIQGSIRRNVIRRGAIVVAGSDGFSSRSNVVEENIVSDGSIRIGEQGHDGVYDIVVKRNVVAGSVLVGDSYEPSIVENKISGCSSRGSGIIVTEFSRLGLFERNVLTGACSFGIEFDDQTRGNLYRDNVVPRATCGLVLDNGLDNTDGGGNKPTRASKKCEAPTE
jgi:hypothetical protein